MIFHFLGTCSGTEPLPGTHHSSFILETGGLYYWFEAGENCVHKASEMGLDVMRTAALFVSHGHIDHVGGMANLLSCFNKLARAYGRTLVRENTLHLHFPDQPELLSAVKTVATMGSHHFRYEIIDHVIADGLLYEDENLRVSALHNEHMKETGENGWHAFSFLIECEGKHIVFSGDVRRPDELCPLLGKNADLLIMETGHHKVEDVLAFVKENGVKRLLFTHHGRQILDHRAECEALVAVFTEREQIPVRILSDGDEIEL